MTIRAVDIVTMVPRIHEAGRVLHQNEVQNLAGQHAQASAQQVRAEQAQSQVKQTPSSGEVAIRRDRDRKQGSGGGSQRRQETGGSEPSQEKQTRPSGGHKLDIKV